MHTPVSRTILKLAAVLLAATVVAACSDGDDGKRSGTTSTTAASAEARRQAAREEQIAARTRKWDDYNQTRTAYAAKQNAVARDVAARLDAGGLPCPSYTDGQLDLIRATYVTQGLPIPRGGGDCEGGDPADPENVLIEVFGTKHPNGADFVAAKRKLLCQRGKDLGRNPDGTSGFPGIPYVIAEDETWVVQPDSHELNQRIATILGRPARDMCEGIE